MQRALSRTIQALANDSISVYRAQALITALQLAAKNPLIAKQLRAKILSPR